MTVPNLQSDAADFIVHYHEVRVCSMEVCITFLATILMR
jgi:hypothetical protein